MSLCRTYIYPWDGLGHQCEAVMQLTLNYIHVRLAEAVVNVVFIFVSVQGSITPYFCNSKLSCMGQMVFRAAKVLRTSLWSVYEQREDGALQCYPRHTF